MGSRIVVRRLVVVALLAGQAACSGRPAASVPQRTPAASTPISTRARAQRVVKPAQLAGRSLWTIVAQDEKALRRSEYTPDLHRISKGYDGSLLLIFHSVCTGSTDGHCQAVDVFRGSQPKPVWHRQYAGVLALDARPGGFSVKAASYAPTDPLCCSSLPPVVDVYTWRGSHFVESGPLPRGPGS